MKAPKDHLTIQIEVTNACVHHCANCTRLCGHHQKPFFMEYETFCKAVDSVLDHPGLIGVMGGEPTLHPRFADMCRYLYEKLPKDRLPRPGVSALPTDSFMDVRRSIELKNFAIHNYADGPRTVYMGAGLWTTMPMPYRKNFEIIQDVFVFQNLNDHTSVSYHQPVLISRKDMGISDEEWLKLREKCWINQQWSSSITPKGCFFCEVAAALDMLYDGPGGLPIEKGWWKRDINDFKDQFHWCELCGIPLKTFARDAREGIVDVSAQNLELLKTKRTAKFVPERVNAVEIKNGIISEESKKAVLTYQGINYLHDAAERISWQTPIYADSFTGVVFCDSAAEYERNEAVIQNNMAYCSELYVIIDGKVYAQLPGEGKTRPEQTKKQSLTEFLREQKEGTYFIFMTAGVELGAGFEKLKKCVVNPGTLHMIDLSERQKSSANPYIANAGALQSGVCALLNNSALSLKKINEEAEFAPEGLRKLLQMWQPEKRVELSAEMDALMWGAGEEKNQQETRWRRRQMLVDCSMRFLKQYGLFTVAAIGVKYLKNHGVKMLIEKLRGRAL